MKGYKHNLLTDNILMSDYLEKIKDNCIKKIDTITFNKRGLEKEYIKKYNFLMKNSNDITYDLIKIAEVSIDRINGLNKIKQYIKEEFIADEIEKGLFEFALMDTCIKRKLYHFCVPIYEHQLYTICFNIDVKHACVQNKTLFNAIIMNKINPYMVAFLPASLMHPVRYESIMQKKLREDDALYNVETTDKYTCVNPNCGEKKCVVQSVQLRSADESESKIVTCIVCSQTYIL